MIDDVFTAQAFITTDLDDNQITAFHPGAMNQSELNKVAEAKGVKIGMVSPDGRTGMIEHAAQFAEAGIPFVFDPGQGLPMFDGEDLRRFVEPGYLGHRQRLRVAASQGAHGLGRG